MRKLKQKSVVAPMRKFCLGSCFTVLFMALCISACSDDDDDAEKSVFPKNSAKICRIAKNERFTSVSPQ